jgi:uncharacterized protein (TIGR02466 family)
MVSLTTVARADVGNMLRAAYAVHSDHPETVRRLARYLFSIDALEELVQLLGSVRRESETDAEVLHFVGLAAMALGNNALAELTLSRAVANGHSESLGHWAKALHALDRTTEAYSVATRALEQSPDDDPAGLVIFSMLLAEQRYAEVWDLGLRLRAARGWTARLVSAMALAAQTPDQIALVRPMTDQDTWLEQTTLSLSRRFRTELSHALKNLNIWKPLPRTKATVGGGRRIEKIQQFSDHPQLRRLFSHIQLAIANYVDRRADWFGSSADDQPMMAMRPDCLTLSGWVIAVNMDGHEGWHIHPDGWLSGVFYVDVPDMCTTDAVNAGQIEFGPYPLGPAANAAVWPRWTIQPRSGDLLLFPSYLAHRTWPTCVEQDRICIAFDVLRRGVECPIKASEAHRAQPKVGLDDRVGRHKRAISATGDAGAQLIMNVDSGQYLALDEVGALLWKLLKEPHTTRELTRTLLGEFDGNEAEMAKSIANVLGVMISYGVAEFV